MRGIELKEGTGQKGFFEVRCIKGGTDPEDISIGLATHDQDLTWRRLSNGYEGIGWRSGRLLIKDSLSGICSFGESFPPLSPEFTTGDVLGLMIDCTGAPTLNLFVNRTKVLEIVFTPRLQGKKLFPVFKLCGNSEIEIFQNPDLPQDGKMTARLA